MDREVRTKALWRKVWVLYGVMVALVVILVLCFMTQENQPEHPEQHLHRKASG
jgi:uncharacterized membrane protein